MKLLWVLVYLTVIHLNRVVETTDNGNGLTGSTSTSKTTTNSNVKKVVDKEVVNNGCGCTLKNVFFGMITLGIYNCVMYHKHGSSGNSKSATGDIDLELTNRKTCSGYEYTRNNKIDIYTVKGECKIVSVKWVKDEVWKSDKSDEKATKVEYEFEKLLITIHLGENKTKKFKKNNDQKWEEDKTQTGTTGTGSTGTGTGSTGQTTPTSGSQPTSGGGTTN